MIKSEKCIQKIIIVKFTNNMFIQQVELCSDAVELILYTLSVC